jgi:hypothetical protein
MQSQMSNVKSASASKPRRKSPVGPRCRTAQTSRSPRTGERSGTSPRRRASLRQQARDLHASLPTALERDTLLTPLWVAEAVVQEVERFLKSDLPANFAKRLATRAEYLYPRHKHFKKMLNRPGNAGRNNLYMYMRHWTAGWLKRARSPLYKKLPWSFGQGQPL